jgi:hypothetical protein
MAMTIQCPIPSNINPLSPNGFNFSVTKLPEITFFCQSVNLPGIILGEPQFANPLSKQPIPGDELTYEQLNVQFLIDEEMKNYTAIYDWMIALGFPEDYNQYKQLVGDRARGSSELISNFSDATLTILNANNTKVKEIYFKDVFPTSLESLLFSSTNNDVNYMVGNASFRFGYYKIL